MNRILILSTFAIYALGGVGAAQAEAVNPSGDRVPGVPKLTVDTQTPPAKPQPPPKPKDDPNLMTDQQKRNNCIMTQGKGPGCRQ
jgi:hypothetical protein